MDWKEGAFYLVPSSGGKAIGWIYQSNDLSERDSGPAEFKVAKVPQDMLKLGYGRGSTVRFSDEAPPIPSWAICFRETCHNIMDNEGASMDVQTCFTIDDANIDALKTAFTYADSGSDHASTNIEHLEHA